jgi:hypothetical protein
VQRQHVQIHIGGADLPSLWRADDHDFEFRIGSDETIQSVVSAFDDERRRTQATLREIDVDRPITVYGRLNTVGRLLVDVVQETARHVGHIDIVRELVDGATGE